MSKPWWESKTLWINILVAVSMILVESQDWEFMPEQWEGYAIAAVAVVNILLRTITTQAVTLRSNG